MAEPTPRIPLANFCPVCGAKGAELEEGSTINNCTPWSCRACGYGWVMVRPGLDNWHGEPAPARWLRFQAANGGPHVVGRIIRGRK